MKILHREQDTVLVIHQALEHVASAMSFEKIIGIGELGGFNGKIENFRY